MTKQLATVPLIESDVKARDEQRLRQLLAQQSVLDSDRTNVERLGSEAGDVRLQGLLRPPLASDKAELLATELSELSQSAKPQVPLFRRDDNRSPGRFERRGYYSVEDATVRPAHPADQSVFEVDVSLSQVGTRGDAYRAVRVSPETIDHAWTDGSSTSKLLIPAFDSDNGDVVSKPQWFNEQTGETELTTAGLLEDATAGYRLRIRDIRDAAVGTDAPTLIYDILYEADVFGVRVYDTRGADSRLSPQNIRQWQVIHSSGHEIDDEVVIQNGQVRMFISEPPTPSIRAQEYFPFGGGWDNDVTLPDTGWKPLDLNLLEINQQRVAGQLRFFDTDTDATHPLNFKLAVGDERILFYTPENVSASVPSGLFDLLDPIAAETDQNLQARRTLIPKSEVQK